MKKAILILTPLLTCTFSSNAQNDTTVEETILWLNTYPAKLISLDYFSKLENFVYKIKFDCKLTDKDAVEFEWADSGYSNEYKYWKKFALKNIKSIYLGPSQYIFFCKS